MTATERQNLEGMQRVLDAKQARQRDRERKTRPPKAANDRRKYGKRGWTWTP